MRVAVAHMRVDLASLLWRLGCMNEGAMCFEMEFWKGRGLEWGPVLAYGHLICVMRG